MTITGALVGGSVGVSCHILNNAVRKIPLSRYPWGHVGLFIGGAYIGAKYEKFEKQQVIDVNEMRTDRGLPQLLGTEAFFPIKTKVEVAEEEAAENIEKGPDMPSPEANPLGQFFKWLNNEIKVAEKLKKDNVVGVVQYDKQDLAERKTEFTQYFFKKLSEREDYDDAVRDFCKKMSAQTKFGLPEGTTLDDIKAIRKKFAQKRIEKMGPIDEAELMKAKEAFENRKIIPGPDIEISKYPEDLQEEMRRTGNHIKLKDYLRAKTEAFVKMSYEEQKEYMRSLMKTQKEWNAFTVEEKLHYSVPDFDDLPYVEQKKLRKNMQDAEKYSLPFISSSNPDEEVENSEAFQAFELLALQKQQNKISPL